jgi:hypothetical protein
MQLAGTVRMHQLLQDPVKAIKRSLVVLLRQGELDRNIFRWDPDAACFQKLV